MSSKPPTSTSSSSSSLIAPLVSSTTGEAGRWTILAPGKEEAIIEGGEEGLALEGSADAEGGVLFCVLPLLLLVAVVMLLVLTGRRGGGSVLAQSDEGVQRGGLLLLMMSTREGESFVGVGDLVAVGEATGVLVGARGGGGGRRRQWRGAVGDEEGEKEVVERGGAKASLLEQ